MGPSSSLLISFFLVFSFAILIHFSQFLNLVSIFSVFACLLIGETLLFETKKLKKNWFLDYSCGRFCVILDFLCFFNSVSFFC